MFHQIGQDARNRVVILTGAVATQQNGST